MGSTKRARARVMAIAVGLGAAVMTGQGFATAEPGGSSDSPSSESSFPDSSTSHGTSTDRSAAPEPTSSPSGGSEQTSDADTVPVTTDTSELTEDTPTSEESPATSDPEPEIIHATSTAEIPTETTDQQSIAQSEETTTVDDSLDESATSDIPEPPEQDLPTDATTPQPTVDGKVSTADEVTATEPASIGETTGPVVAEISSMVNALSETAGTMMVANARTVAPAQTTSAPTAPITPHAGLVVATGFFLWLGIPPLGGTVPVAPPPPTWALLAVVRRFIDNTLFNSAPIVTAPPTVNSGQDAVTGAITGTINVADANHDRLIYTVTQGTNGTAVVNSDGTFVYTPDAATLAGGGTDSFTVTVSDATNFHLHLPRIFGGHTTQVAVPITVAPSSTNQAPTLLVVAGQTNTQTGAIDYTVTTSDPDGDTVSISRADDVDHGTLTDNGNGTYTYIPDPVYAHAVAAGGPNTDSFTLVADDGQGGSDTVVNAITVIGQNAAPTLVVDAGDRDAETGAIVYTVTTTDADGDTPVVTTTAPTHGSLTDHGNGTYTYTPGTRFVSGTDAFSVSVDDGHGGTTTELVTVTVAGQFATITVPIDGIPNEVIVSRDGNHVFVISSQYDLVTNSYTGTLTVVNTTTSTPTITTTAIDGIPIDVTVTADGGRVLITSAQYDFVNYSYTGGTLTVVDTTTPTPSTTTTAIDGRPTNTIVSADGDHVFITSAQYDNVTGSYTRRLTVVDTTTAIATAIVTTTIGVYPDDLVVTADGDYAFVTTYLFDDSTGSYVYSLAVVDTTTPTPTITTVTLDGGRTDLLVTADGDHAFVTSYSYDSTTLRFTGTLTVVDTTTPTPTITTTAIDGYPDNLTVTADDDYVYLTSYQNDETTGRDIGTLTVVDTTTPTPTVTSTTTIDGRPTYAVVSPDGDHVFVISEQYDPTTHNVYTSTLTVVDTTTPTPTIVSTTTLDGDPDDIVATADGNYAFVTTEHSDANNRYNGSVTIVDTTTPTPTVITVTLDSRPDNLTVTADGSYAFLTDYRPDETGRHSGTLTVVDTTTPTPTIITTTIGAPSDLTLTADGNYAFLTAYQNDETTADTGTLTVVDITTPTPTITTTTITGRPTNAVVSADGKYVLVTSVQYDNATNTYTASLVAVALSSSSASTV